jgi:hypothetical protein
LCDFAHATLALEPGDRAAVGQADCVLRDAVVDEETVGDDHAGASRRSGAGEDRHDPGGQEKGRVSHGSDLTQYREEGGKCPALTDTSKTA